MLKQIINPDPSLPYQIDRRTPSPRKRFRAIGVVGTNQLGLLAVNLCLCRITYRNKELVLEEEGQQMEELFDDPRVGGRFEEVPSPSRGYSLARADWKEGSQAWLDSRGLLHLKSRCTELPEITLVLRDGPVSAWLSDGRYAGERYFTGDSPRMEMAEVARLLERFVEHCLER